jgi:hypothetical protein
MIKNYLKRLFRHQCNFTKIENWDFYQRYTHYHRSQYFVCPLPPHHKTFSTHRGWVVRQAHLWSQKSHRSLPDPLLRSPGGGANSSDDDLSPAPCAHQHHIPPARPTACPAQQRSPAPDRPVTHSVRPIAAEGWAARGGAWDGTQASGVSLSNGLRGDAEVPVLWPQTPGRQDGEGVRFVCPGRCPACDQKKLRPPGRPHSGECMRWRPSGTMARSASCRGRAAGNRATGRRTGAGRRAAQCSPSSPGQGITPPRAGLLRVSTSPNYASLQAVRGQLGSRAGVGQRKGSDPGGAA